MLFTSLYATVYNNALYIGENKLFKKYKKIIVSLGPSTVPHRVGLQLH